MTVLRACLASARRVLDPECRVVALVGTEEVGDYPGVELRNLTARNRGWIGRLKLEYRHFDELSREIRPDFWLSLHDTSPFVSHGKQAVYCHNPAPFFDLKWRDAMIAPVLVAYKLFYQFIYRLNLRSNAFVIVQQEWLREIFQRRFGAKRVIVAHPDIPDLRSPPARIAPAGPRILLYPTIPRAFKNLETVCRAVRKLREDGGDPVELRITISGNENRYACGIFRAFGDEPWIRFIGRQPREAMQREFETCSALVFPSRLETWGLPITEAKLFGLPILAADLPYAHESVGSYDQVRFVPATDHHAWAAAIEQFAFDRVEQPDPEPPFVTNWDDLWRFLESTSNQISGKC